ncbi:MAG: hypothetical protein ACOCXA_06795 [Planctomycetota bacterium]
MRVRLGLTLGLCSCLSAFESGGWILHNERLGDLGWSQRLVGLDDASIMGGYSRQVLPSTTGISQAKRLRLRWGSNGQPAPLPGDAPIYDGLQAIVDGDVAGSWGPFFVSARPQLVLGFDHSQDRVPYRDPREIWMGNEAHADLDTVEILPRLSLGLHGLGHVLAISDQPFRWGEGIFGGIVVGGAQAGFPHLAFAPKRAWQLLEIAHDPVLFRYEFALGLLDDRAGIDSPAWGGTRLSLRWKDVTLSATVAGQAEHDDLEPGILSDREYFNAIRSFGINYQLGKRAEIRVEYGQDDYHPKSTRSDDLFTDELEEYAPDTSAWTATVDILDLLGDQRWRLALEWYRSESYFYNHHHFDSWYTDGHPIGHPDGGNTNSLRLLLQHQYRDKRSIGLLAYWRRYGWRNAESNNPNDDRPTNGNDPGEASFAERPWDQFGWYTWHDYQLREAGKLHIEAGALVEEDRMFQSTGKKLEWHLGAGYSRRW